MQLLESPAELPKALRLALAWYQKSQRGTNLWAEAVRGPHQHRIQILPRDHAVGSRVWLGADCLLVPDD